MVTCRCGITGFSSAVGKVDAHPKGVVSLPPDGMLPNRKLRGELVTCRYGIAGFSSPAGQV